MAWTSCCWLPFLILMLQSSLLMFAYPHKSFIIFLVLSMRASHLPGNTRRRCSHHLLRNYNPSIIFSGSASSLQVLLQEMAVLAISPSGLQSSCVMWFAQRFHTWTNKDELTENNWGAGDTIRSIRRFLIFFWVGIRGSCMISPQQAAREPKGELAGSGTLAPMTIWSVRNFFSNYAWMGCRGSCVISPAGCGV